MKALLIAIVVAVGIGNALQAGPNAEMTRRLGQPIAATLLIDGVGLLVMFAIAPLLGLRATSYQHLRELPWWSWLGGFFGAGYIVALTYTVPKLGVGVFVAVTVTAGVVVSIALDHFGVLGIDRHAATWPRLLGALLMTGGVVLVARS